jgi:sporulation protein YqfD
VRRDPSWPEALRARVVVRLSGDRPDAALARALAHGVCVEAARTLPGGTLELVVAAPMLRALRRETRGRARVRVLRRLGGPYLWRRVAARPGLVGGAAAFVVALSLLGQTVWAVRVVGVGGRDGRRVVAAARALGIVPGAWRSAVRPDAAARALAATVPGLAWAGVRLDGGLVVIRALFALRPRAGEVSARTLVAARSARVVVVHLRQGRLEVRVGERVREGQALVRGYLAEGSPLKDGAPGPLVWVAPRAVVIARWPVAASAVAGRRAAVEVQTTRTLRWMFAVRGRTLGSGELRAGRGAAGALAALAPTLDWRIRLWGSEWIAIRAERVVVERRTWRRRSRREATAIALAAAQRALARAAGSGVRLGDRRVAVRWREGRVTVTIRAVAQADIARPEGKAPAAP